MKAAQRNFKPFQARKGRTWRHSAEHPGTTSLPAIPAVPAPPDHTLNVKPRLIQSRLTLNIVDSADESWISLADEFWRTWLCHGPIREINLTVSPTFTGLGLTDECMSLFGGLWSAIYAHLVGDITISPNLQRINITFAPVGWRLFAASGALHSTPYTPDQMARAVPCGDLISSGLLELLEVDYSGLMPHTAPINPYVDRSLPLISLNIPDVAVISAPNQFPEVKWRDDALKAAAGRCLRFLAPSADISSADVPESMHRAEMAEIVARTKNFIREQEERIRERFEMKEQPIIKILTVSCKACGHLNDVTNVDILTA
jgi:hypothetical protein